MSLSIHQFKLNANSTKSSDNIFNSSIHQFFSKEYDSSAGNTPSNAFELQCRQVIKSN